MARRNEAAPGSTGDRETGLPGRSYGTVEVARILGTTPRRIRRHVHAGLCRPSRRGLAFRFNFRDLVLLRTAQGLLAAGISARTLHRTLANVTRRLGDEPISGLRFHVLGRRIVVQEGTTAWHSEDGQLLFAFRLDDLARKAGVGRTPPTPLGRRKSPPRTADADGWFERGVELERAGDAEAAADAYRRSLDLAPHQGDAAVNLGRLLHAAGRLQESSHLYRRALAIDDGDAVAHYNLALVLEDFGRPKAAIAHYKKAVAREPAFADAHYNLARLFEDLGRHAEAVRHFLTYSKLTDG